jgi:hypothetical protein
MWKHRDTNRAQNRLAWFTDGKYKYLALLNTKDAKGKHAWAGMNETGFAVMNSASYNLNSEEDDEDAKKDQEGVVMKAALRTCATVDDFEHLLKRWPRPMGVAANFGVIDAKGGAAFFEASNTGYVKIDVNDPKQAPDGYVIRSNYSVTGREDDGKGYIRHATAKKIFAEAANRNELTPRFLIKEASRCLKHSLTGRDLRKEGETLPAGRSKWVFFLDYIPRTTSTSAMVIQGVKPGEDPSLCTSWTILGFPLTSIAVPAWAGAAPELPHIVQSVKKAPAPLCNLALRLKKRCFPIQRGNGSFYLRLPRLVNRDGTGLLQQIDPIETRLLDKTDAMIRRWRGKKPDPAQVKEFYQWIDGPLFEELCTATGK